MKATELAEEIYKLLQEKAATTEIPAVLSIISILHSLDQIKAIDESKGYGI